MQEQFKYSKRQIRFYLTEKVIHKITVRSEQTGRTLSDVVETELMKLDIRKADKKAKDNDSNTIT